MLDERGLPIDTTETIVQSKWDPPHVATDADRKERQMGSKGKRIIRCAETWMPRFLAAGIATMAEMDHAFRRQHWRLIGEWKDEWRAMGSPEPVYAAQKMAEHALEPCPRAERRGSEGGGAP